MFTPTNASEYNNSIIGPTSVRTKPQPRAAATARSVKKWNAFAIFPLVSLCFVYVVLQMKLFMFQPMFDQSSSSTSLVAAVVSNKFNDLFATTTTSYSKTKQPLKIAYAISITKCQPPKRNAIIGALDLDRAVIDSAAVLAHSIHLNSIRNKQQQQPISKYDYEMIAFIHPEGVNCTDHFENIGYKTFLKPTPVNVSEIQSTYYRERVVKGGCCGEKEYLKLYTWTLTDYPVAVHLDTDSLVLKPMDDLFDAIIYGNDESVDIEDQTSKIHTMWTGTQRNWFEQDADNNNTAKSTNTTEGTTPRTKSTLPKQIDAFFTRDYNMINPSYFFEIAKLQPKHVGVQGGFIVVRPSMEIYHELREQVLIGNFTEKKKWGNLDFGGFYGDETIQGLWAYYYGHLLPILLSKNTERGSSVELNRCYYNQMADTPIEVHSKTNRTYCRTGDTLDECEDCRQTKFEDVYSAHLTVCGKPHWCPRRGSPICGSFLSRWYEVRQSLQSVWENSNGNGNKNTSTTSTTYNITMDYSGKEYDIIYRKGICGKHGNGNYIPLQIPSPSLS